MDITPDGSTVVRMDRLVCHCSTHDDILIFHVSLYPIFFNNLGRCSESKDIW